MRNREKIHPQEYVTPKAHQKTCIDWTEPEEKIEKKYKTH